MLSSYCFNKDDSVGESFAVHLRELGVTVTLPLETTLTVNFFLLRPILDVV